LVIGGTTFFGKAIVEELLEAGHKVAVFSRGQQRPAFFDSDGVEHIRGDRTNREEFNNALSGRTFDGVIDNIAYTPEDVRHALDAFRGRAGRYVFTSTAAVYYTGSMVMPVPEGDVEYSFEPPQGERSSPFWGYTIGKLHGERVLREQAGDLPYTIIRPPVVLGPEDPTLRGYFYFQRLMDERPLIVTNGGVQSFRLVYSRDLARGYLRALERREAAGQIYNLAQHEVVRLIDLLQEAANVLEVSPTFVNVPAGVLAQSRLDYQEPYARMSNFIPDISKAERELSYATTPFVAWLGETVLWYRDAYQGPDSAGYAERDREVKLAERFQELTAKLAA
jgi:nucleoside-diphosphate-sugar epimerase